MKRAVIKKVIVNILFCLLISSPINAQENVNNTVVELEKINSETILPPTLNETNLTPKDNTIFYSNLAIKEFKDLDQNKWAFQAVAELTKKYSVLVGMPDKTFQGDRPASRYELAQALAKLITKIDQDNLQLSPVEQAALKSLQAEFNKEILTLAARIEKNEYQMTKIEDTHKTDVEKLTNSVNTLNDKNYISPEIRLRYGFGDALTNDGAFTDTRLRLLSNTKLYNKTFATLRLQAITPNLINVSEKFNEPVTTDLNLAYIKTGELTNWLPEKAGRIDFYGGLMPTNRLVYVNGYSVEVDQRAFNYSNISVSAFNSFFQACARESADGRRMSIGGEYYKNFSKHNGLIKVGALRSTGGSIERLGSDIFSSGHESTYLSAMGQLDLPIKKQPVELKVAHFYSLNDNATNRRTYALGGRLSTKFEGVGVFKAALIGYGGTVPPQLLEGTGGHGFSYQLSYSPTIKSFGKLFGDPDRITYRTPCYEPGKTEIGLAIANLHNDQQESIRAFDLFMTRYITKNIFGRILLSHVNPSTRERGLSARNYILFETILQF